MDIRSDILSLNPKAKFSGLMATKHWPWEHKQANDDVGSNPAKSCDIDRYSRFTDCANLLDKKDKSVSTCEICALHVSLLHESSFYQVCHWSTQFACLKQTRVSWVNWSAVAHFMLLLFIESEHYRHIFCCKHSDKKKRSVQHTYQVSDTVRYFPGSNVFAVLGTRQDATKYLHHHPQTVTFVPSWGQTENTVKTMGRVTRR